jgi:hypothetical protein
MTHINETLIAYFQTNGATSEDFDDAAEEFLIAQGQTDDVSLNDKWFAYLGGLGYTGTLADRRAEWIDAVIL